MSSLALCMVGSPPVAELAQANPRPHNMVALASPGADGALALNDPNASGVFDRAGFFLGDPGANTLARTRMLGADTMRLTLLQILPRLRGGPRAPPPPAFSYGKTYPGTERSSAGKKIN